MSSKKVSIKYSLNKHDLTRIAIGAGVALAGALLTYVSETITSIDFGSSTPLVVAFWSILANVARKYLSGEVITR